jgi:predicted alpha/beta-hydrolase family hydrolase
VTARVRGAGDVAIVLAHGAGTNQDHPLVSGLAEALAIGGPTVVTFNYPYTEADGRRPNPAAVLLECHRAVAAWVRAEVNDRVVLAGRSMGGRMATMAASDGDRCLGVVAFAYPLHPAGKPDRLRVAHLASVGVPMLFFQGGRDTLSRADLFDEHVRSLPGVEVFDLPGLDHSWRGRGVVRDELLSLVANETVGWIERRFAT